VSLSLPYSNLGVLGIHIREAFFTGYIYVPMGLEGTMYSKLYSIRHKTRTNSYTLSVQKRMQLYFYVSQTDTSLIKFIVNNINIYMSK
jgi:hypothetical protein